MTLLGTRERAQVMEYLRGPPLTIEVHDRDRKATPPPARSVFGQERDDNVIGTQEYCKGNVAIETCCRGDVLGLQYNLMTLLVAKVISPFGLRLWSCDLAN